MNIGIILLVSFGWFCVYSHFSWKKKNTCACTSVYVGALLMCWWYGLYISGVHNVSKVIYWMSYYSVAMLFPQDRSHWPWNWTASQEHPAFLVSSLPIVLGVQIHSWLHSMWSYPFSHLLGPKLLFNWFCLLCLCFSLMCSHNPWVHVLLTLKYFQNPFRIANIRVCLVLFYFSYSDSRCKYIVIIGQITLPSWLIFYFWEFHVYNKRWSYVPTISPSSSPYILPHIPLLTLCL